ncbi:hypothetical protein [Nodularia sp. UHCC 0506]|uniref:hypothetical protein n=1 Tax=Nodularia sp. UHCC 0506 TaxID=3110243 RepID=UPI002B1F6D2A|nr:hypothetical protein [Nodularia sp. UHCC 0506]MEA5515181.1 hypothetical protein [Nodularia sp. UHCC 0506]
MKTTLKKYGVTYQARIITALILTGILSVSGIFTLIESATADSTNFAPKTHNQVLVKNNQNPLPRAVANAVRRDLARRQRILNKDIKIIDYRQQTWNNGCLELPQPNELCSQALVPGWRVVVSNHKQNWIYHTNSNGRSLRLASANPSRNLPQSVKNAVFQAASQRLQLPTSRLKVIEAQQQTWNNGCLNLAAAGEFCTQALVQGWRVTVGAANQTLVYHTNQTGSTVRLNEKASNISDKQLPRKIRDAVLRDASNRARTKIAVNTRNITQAEKVVWSNGCLDLGRGPCTLALVPGWRVTVAIAPERFVYHTDEDSLVKFNAAASKIVGNPGNVGVIAIPARELPPPLTQGMVFRQISSGGLLGKTYETVLLNDGRLMRVRIGDANDSERSVWRISSQQVRQFQQLLKRSKFTNLSYPAPRGAADYFTYTLTSREGTVKYNDISQNNLPQNLREVVNSWNRIVTSVQR